MRLHLPKGKDRVAKAVRHAITTGVAARNPLSVGWYRGYHYLQGVRNFNVLSWKTGTVRHTWDSADGGLDFRVEAVLEHYNRMLGLMLGADSTPLAKPKKNLSLDGARKAAIAQLYLDTAMGAINQEQLAKDHFEGLLQFGTMGIFVESSADANVPGGAVLRNVPPWQLLPLPGDPTMASEVGGKIRHRWVSLEWLKEATAGNRLSFPGKDSLRNPHESLRVRWLSPGDKEPNDHDANDLSSQYEFDPMRDNEGPDTPTSREEHRDKNPYVELVECWLEDDVGCVDRMITLVGDHVAYDETFSGESEKPRTPGGVSRFNHAGGFFGRSFIDPLIPINEQVEKMYGNMFRNVSELDQFGMVFLPADQGITRRQLTDTGNGPNIQFYEKDYMGGKFEVERVQPTNTGDAPGRVAATGMQILDQLSGSSPLDRGDAPGRVDSASGLGLLHETRSMPRKPTFLSVANAFGVAYSCLLQRISNAPANMAVKMTSIDHNVAGIQFDPATGDLLLKNNPVPTNDDVIVTIRQMEPRMNSQRKQELVLMLDKGAIDLHEFRWINHLERLGFPAGGDAEIEQRKLCMWRNILQFNDGVTPIPEGVTTSNNDMHEIHLRAIEAFQSLAIYHLASPGIKDSFDERKQFHEQQLGGFPDQLPYPEDSGMTIPEGLPPGLEQEAMRMAKKGGAAAPGEQLPPQLMG